MPISLTHWLPWALLSAFFAALTAITAKVGVREVDSDLATLLRAAFITLVLIPIVCLSGKWSDPRGLPTRTLLFLALSALATGASWLCYFRALKLGDASQVAPVDKLSVVLVAILAALFLGERPTPKDWLAILLISGGVVLLAIRR
jgi:bacterial/archaeal transporter family protein